MGAEAELLFANERFYAAFRSRDCAAMEALWARRGPVACVHPGWRALDSRQEVMASWRGILANPQSPEVVCRGARAHVFGDTGLVVCYELIGAGALAATNVFVREDGAWKMVHHHAGPCDAPPVAPEEAPATGRLQ